VGVKLRVCDAAALVLRETGNPAVMWGDSGLLHMIAERAEMESRGRAWKTERAVLGALSKQPGVLVPMMTWSHPAGGRHRVRIFYLPERTERCA
jgi:hypothetical protein